MNSRPVRIALAGATLALAACTTSMPRSKTEAAPMFSAVRTTEHRGSDDLLSAGLGLAGLRAVAPPAFADVEHPTAAELRRRALWSNWRGIADLAPGGGYGELYGSTAAVPGREFSALATVAGASQPHRVLVQVPDAFDTGKRCVVVTASSGSRGIYGAIAVAGAWGLPRGCAVAYTDKGAGSDYFDLDAGQGARPDGTVGARGEGLAFEPATTATAGVAFKHAHSRDNPEADWGRHVKQAAQFALQSLDSAFPQAAPFTFDNTRVIAVGISNGGGAVLRAAELDGDWLDAVVVAEPNIHAESEGSRALYDYTTEAALLMPCALLHMQDLPQPPLTAQATPLWTQRCTALKSAGLIDGSDTAAQAKSAHDTLRANGWSEQALRAGALSVGFDLWRAVTVTYASAYGRYGFGEMPCGNRYSALNTDFSPRAATGAERAAWWSDASGIPPGAGVSIIEEHPTSPLTTLQCLRALWTGDDGNAQRVRKGIAETRASLPRKGLPVVVIHGSDDGLIPPAFTSAPYVRQAQAAGRNVRYWQVRNAQHFDAFLGLPDYGARYLPLLPYVYAALDRVSATLDGAATLPADAVIATTPRAGKPLEAANLSIPR
ncbi:MAG TPA: 3-hydroxybutyrate oligomer hydrolase family protein [Lysobacter sp.]